MRWLLLMLALSACGEGEIGSPPAPDAGGAAEDGGVPVDGGVLPPPGQDTDGDGLPDAVELAAGRADLLDPARVDTDGDGRQDGAEDPDQDGLTNLEELALWRLPSAPPGCRPSLLKRTLLLELDAMAQRTVGDELLAVVQGAFAALPTSSVDGSAGLELCVYRDEEDVPAVDLDGDFAGRAALLLRHGPAFADRAAPPIPYGQMLHAMLVTVRTDNPARGGDTLASGGVEESGVLIYVDALDALHPACATPQLPPITREDAVAGSLVHELGHLLQLGHDTEVGGGVVHHNIMSLQTSCLEGQMRAHGVMNDDPTLGNTEAVSAPRFSHAAARLMRFGNRISVDTGDFEDSDGREM